jgi:hypothetical protein
MKKIITLISILILCSVFGQSQIKKVLFLGNSYTAVNNLPQLIADVAASVGDTVIFESNTPGGYTLHGHSENTTSLEKIKAGSWDYVVLQEQSQLLSLPIEQVITEVFPYADILDSVINAYNHCGETAFFMTWGRKNGDASNCPEWPPVCTYEGMDSLLNLRYRMMADSNDAIIAPVGAVWHYIRVNYPSIELYQADESHPSLAGSYAAACCFYSVMFRKNPELISFNSSLPPENAVSIRIAAKLMVYDSLMNWHIGEYDPVSGFSYFVNDALTVSFTNSSVGSESYLWNFGDGDTSTQINPIHEYASAGIYNVTLIACKCNLADTLLQIIELSTTGMDKEAVRTNLTWELSPNPASNSITLKLKGNRILNYIIVNCLGKEMQYGILRTSEEQISVATFPTGLYILQILDHENSCGWKKLLVTKQ